MRILTRPQLLGWMVWQSIRGPIGPMRRDHYVKYLAEHADPQVSQPEFDFPWVLPEAELARLRSGRG